METGNKIESIRRAIHDVTRSDDEVFSAIRAIVSPGVNEPMGGRCETCRWWYELQMHQSPDKRRGICNLLGSTGDKPNHPEAKAQAYGPKSFMSDLWTEPDFYCNQWEPKGGTTED